MLVERMEPDFKFENDNGSLIQLVHSGWKQVNVLYSKKNSKRGGHYHKICREAFYVVSGKIMLTLEKNDQYEKTLFEAGEMFLIHPYEMHVFEFLEDTIMISLYDKGVELEDGAKDIYTK